jgi:hypothetical protein
VSGGQEVRSFAVQKEMVSCDMGNRGTSFIRRIVARRRVGAQNK